MVEMERRKGGRRTEKKGAVKPNRPASGCDSRHGKEEGKESKSGNEFLLMMKGEETRKEKQGQIPTTRNDCSR